MISIFTGIISGLTIGEYEENEVIKRAGLMINSVKQYKQVTGKYPGKTDELVPEYIPSGYNFNKLKYEKRNEKYFRIIINTRNCGMIFESEDNRWHYRPCP